MEFDHIDDFIELNFTTQISKEENPNIFSNKIFNNQIIQNRAKTGKERELSSNLKSVKKNKYDMSISGSTFNSKNLNTNEQIRNTQTIYKNTNENTNLILVKHNEAIKKPKNSYVTLDQIYSTSQHSKPSISFRGEKLDLANEYSEAFDRYGRGSITDDSQKNACSVSDYYFNFTRQ